MSIDTPTPAAEVAPPKYLECPRCGSVTFTRHGVKKHDGEHEKQDQRDKRHDGLLDRLEQFLNSIEGDPEGGDAVSLPDWMAGIEETIEELQKARPAAGGSLTLEAGEWPTDGIPTEAPVALIPGTEIPDVGDLIADDDDDTDAHPWGARR